MHNNVISERSPGLILGATCKTVCIYLPLVVPLVTDVAQQRPLSQDDANKIQTQ